MPAPLIGAAIAAVGRAALPLLARSAGTAATAGRVGNFATGVQDAMRLVNTGQNVMSGVRMAESVADRAESPTAMNNIAI